MKCPKSFSFFGSKGTSYRVYLNQQSGYWFVAYVVGEKRVRRSLDAKTKVEAEYAVQLLDSRRTNTATLNSNVEQFAPMTWATFQKQYLAYKVQTEKAPKTIARYKSGLDAFGRYLRKRGVDDVHAISLVVLEGYCEFRSKEEECAPKTVYNDVLAIKNAMKWASKASRGVLRSNPSLDWETPKPITPKRRCYTADEVNKMELGVRDWLKPIVTTLSLTGLRIGELVNLRWVDVDLEKRVLFVRVQEEWKPKGRRDRVVPMHPRVEAAIRSRPVGVYVFVGPNGGRIKETYALECLKDDQEELGMTKGDLHAFRRYFATSMMKAGVSVESVRQWGGWKSLDTMLRYLADIDVKESVEAMDQAAKRLA